MSLEDDIARIAALRGRKATDYTERQVHKPKPTRDHLQMIFQMTRDSDVDQLAFDELPQASRDFIRECPHAINSRLWGGLLSNFREPDLIDLARSMITWPTSTRRARPRRA